MVVTRINLVPAANDDEAATLDELSIDVFGSLSEAVGFAQHR